MRPKKLQLSENADSKLLVAHCKAQGIPVVHVPNEIIGILSKAGLVELAGHLRAMGVGQPGWPDYIMIVRARVRFIELKREHGGTVSPDQVRMLDALRTAGVSAKVCRGFFEARSQIERWASGEEES
jgi:hypothetical protein